MKKALLSILFVGLIGGVSAQTVSDFNWTDTDQNSHGLYNYNTGGKAVVVIFYQTTDATSQQLANDFNQLYYDYGSNTGNVIVLGASVIEENESSIESFMATHSLSYPNVYGYDPSNQFQADYLNNVFTGTTPPFVMVVLPDNTAGYKGNGAGVTVNDVSTALQNEGFNPTGISNALKKNGNFIIFPNPATDRLTVKFMAEAGETTSLEIFNVLGEKIVAEKNSTTGLNILNINTSEYPNGLYFAKLKNGEQTKTIKFEVAR